LNFRVLARLKQRNVLRNVSVGVLAAADYDAVVGCAVVVADNVVGVLAGSVVVAAHSVAVVLSDAVVDHFFVGDVVDVLIVAGGKAVGAVLNLTVVAAEQPSNRGWTFYWSKGWLAARTPSAFLTFSPPPTLSDP